MKQFIVDRHTTPNTPTLEQVPTEKIPVYEDMADAAADLANLAENQIIATHDTGSELSAPVDTVQSGNMHACTSNAVFENCPRFPDYASGNLITQNVSSYTPTEDCYINYLLIASTTNDNYALVIDNVEVSSYDGGTTPARVFSYSGYVKKGSVIRRKDNGDISPSVLKVFKLV